MTADAIANAILWAFMVGAACGLFTGLLIMEHVQKNTDKAGGDI